MRHIEFVINSGLKNKYGKLHFIRFIYNNFKNKDFMGSKDTKNNSWGEKLFFLNVKTILQVFNQRKVIKSKSTKASYVKFLSYGAASVKVLIEDSFVVFSLIVQKSSIKSKHTNVLTFSLVSQVKVRVTHISEVSQLLLLQNIFKLKSC